MFLDKFVITSLKGNYPAFRAFIQHLFPSFLISAEEVYPNLGMRSTTSRCKVWCSVPSNAKDIVLRIMCCSSQKYWKEITGEELKWSKCFNHCVFDSFWVACRLWLVSCQPPVKCNQSTIFELTWFWMWPLRMLLLHQMKCAEAKLCKSLAVQWLQHCEGVGRHEWNLYDLVKEIHRWSWWIPQLHPGFTSTLVKNSWIQIDQY